MKNKETKIEEAIDRMHAREARQKKILQEDDERELPTNRYVEMLNKSQLPDWQHGTHWKRNQVNRKFWKSVRITAYVLLGLCLAWGIISKYI